MTSGLCYCADNKAAAGPEATLAEVQHRLDQLVGLAASSGEVQASLEKDTDFGYAWGIIDTYAEEIKHQVGFDRCFQDSVTISLQNTAPLQCSMKCCVFWVHVWTCFCVAHFDNQV